MEADETDAQSVMSVLDISKLVPLCGAKFRIEFHQLSFCMIDCSASTTLLVNGNSFAYIYSDRNMESHKNQRKIN